MKAAVRVEPRRIEIMERPDPVAGEGQALIAIEHVAICGGDLHFFRGAMPIAAAIPGFIDLPRIVCHEAVGRIVTAPEDSRFRRGERVTFDPQYRCGVCEACRSGYVELCTNRRDMGYAVDGAAAEFVTVPTEQVFSIPEHVDQRAAAASHGLAAVLHALDGIDLANVGSALVIGPGPAGLMFAMALLAMLDEGRTALLGRASPRLKIAADLGAEVITLDADAWSALRFEWGTTRGFDLIIDTTGSANVLQSALWCVRPNGTLLVYAPSEFLLDGNVLLRRKLRVIGSTGATTGMQAALDLVASGQVPLERIVSHSFAFEDIQSAFEMAVAEPAQRGDLLKAVVRVS